MDNKDEVLKIAIVGHNLFDKTEVINKIKTRYNNQSIIVLDVNNLPNDTVFEEYWLNFSAVFYLGDDKSSNESILNWLGHNHFRFIDISKDDDEIYNNLSKELDTLVNNIELEKKLLIKMPSIESLINNYPVYRTHIEQTYLTCANGSHRIRKRTSNSVDTYFETLKLRITDSKCVEFEEIIDRDKYKDLLQLKDPKKNTIVKDRYFVLFEGNRFELDIYEFWDDKATIELEIPDEKYLFNLPPEIEVIKDVSDDYKYKNNYLAGLDYENCKA